MTSTCNSCIYMHRVSDELGQCRRHTPSVHEIQGVAPFPWVNTLEDWCGEYSGNTQPLSETETRAFVDPSLGPTVLITKPTPYRDSKDPIV